MPASFLADPDESPRVRAVYDGDRSVYGFVMNLSHVWAHDPTTLERLQGLLAGLAETGGFSVRDRGILIAAAASTHGDSYCSVAWGGKLAAAADEQIALAVLTGTDSGLTEAERAMARWARAVALDGAATTAAEVQDLRDAGWSDQQIFAMTAFVGLRIAFSTVNSALGAHPDAGLRTITPAAVVDAVTWGRPLEPGSGVR